MDHGKAAIFWQQLWHSLRDADTPLPVIHFCGEQTLSSAYPVSELAATSIALATQAAATLVTNPHPVDVDVRLAARWFQHSLRPLNRQRPSLWDPFAGDYATADGWIRLHTNALHHRQAMESVLGQQSDRQALAETVRSWQKQTLEQAIVAAGGCAAEMRSLNAWRQHAQGQSVAREALIARSLQAQAPPPRWQLPPARPLLGVRVLDLTRIIAGPVATRFLAGLGAEVLRIDAPEWDEPALAEEVTLGKRCARLDLKSAAGRQQFESLLGAADVLVHGYRADALEKLGYSSERLQQLSPGLIDVSLNAWGWSGPWRNRRGFDSLVQMACGIAEAGRQWKNSEQPEPLPVQALDHATGYLMAAAVLEGMRQRQATQCGFSARLSLARTAWLLSDNPATDHPATALVAQPADESDIIEYSAWGIGYRLRAPVWLHGTPLIWSRPPAPLGSSRAQWLHKRN
ncbi:CoA transferase [Erwiniaceae bacterium BAC15a-03b]|uniref:CoA transferase n=1 Tax=Winslowiella arboricola TaxID=2978220 RepID=A0A9J6PYT3_9GAMM|nr:CoA transferase [Winslowiella arboricola]MCU5774796.1 CoA transferase [Winslowiella arboricola]MCU5780052.1 CoA transferase [Winslowiella arboricola]